uniref:RRM domain-containing protein n=1 Tax=Elaeophora elaphi TaxID=1147741 RepID=A0A0R3S0B0_9BILA
MSTEVNCINGGNSEIHRQQQEPLTDGMEKSVVITTTLAAVKSIVTEETGFLPENSGTNSHPVGTLCSASGPSSGNRSQKSKKRQNQKTFSLMDIFDMHKGIGSWADAAADAHTTSYSPSTIQESSETKQVTNALQRASASQQGDWNQYHNNVGNIRPPSLVLDRATHSRNMDLTNLPDRPPFEVKVANINYKSSDNDLLYFFGGEGSVVNIRSEGHAGKRGIAIVSLSSQEALVNALKLNSMVDFNMNFPVDAMVTIFALDNRRYDYDSDRFRHTNPDQLAIRFTNRSIDSHGVSPKPSPLIENHFSNHSMEMEHDADKRGSRRIRTESVRSTTTDSTEKHERRKLQLQPRTKPLNSTGEDLPARPTSIFGLAKPVDTYEKEKQAEERLRLENEAFKAAEQRSRKSSERAVSVPASPLLVHGEVSVVTESPLYDCRENCAQPNQKAVSEENYQSTEAVEKLRTTSVISQLVTNEERVVERAEAPSLVTALASAPRRLPPLEASVLTVRRQSFSNYPEMSETRASTALLRTRNTYNRTFTRSRDSIRTHFPPNRVHNIPVRRGKSGSRRGGATSGILGSNKGKHFAFNREQVEGNSGGSSVEPIVPNGPKQLENGPKPEQQPISKDEKHEFETISNTVTATKQPWQQHSDQQHSKREKKKQAIATKEMPKCVEPKPFTFSSENKYAALLEADD